MMSLPAHLEVHFVPESPEHDGAVEALNAQAFGPGRHAKAAARVREMAAHDPALSFVAIRQGEIVGTVRQTKGPLAGRPALMGRGVGRALMALAAEAAAAAGESVVFLVGDRAYYMPLGYQPLAPGSVSMPGPVDERRILALPLAAGALDGLSGAVGPR